LICDDGEKTQTGAGRFVASKHNITRTQTGAARLSETDSIGEKSQISAGRFVASKHNITRTQTGAARCCERAARVGV